MGNKESSVTAGVKAQANASIEIYSLVDLNGGGELVELMKKATKTKEYSELDETIRSKIPKYTYNSGQGKCLPIHVLVLRRNKERSVTKQITPPKNLPDDDSVAGKYIPEKMDPQYVTDHLTYRFQFWDLKDLGAVGETVLHLCVLNATSVHNDLAKRIIRHFPNVINDVYLCDEYYGENVLHIAIVNEDPSMVKFLLDNGANYHERCIGNFMSVEDQKSSRMDSLEHEWIDFTLNTNYQGYVYWGEYPMSFAACLGQEECYRLILARGADPDKQDTNGNSVCHMMVIYDKMDMFDMCFELGGSYELRNRQGLIPLTLAAILARRDLFFHILNISREIYWQIGNVTCAAYPLDNFDTINTSNGQSDTKSALNLISYGNKEEHLDLMEGPVVDLLKTKWETFIKFKFYNLFVVFSIYFIISTVAYVLRPVPCAKKVAATSTLKAPSLMLLPALGITCVNVSVALGPNMTLDSTLTTMYPNITYGDVESNLKANAARLASESPFSVTLGPLEVGVEVLPSTEEEEDEGDDNKPSSVTAMPHDVVTLEYFVEGESVSATIASTLMDLLTPGTSVVDEDSQGPSLPPLLFKCYNKSHNLDLVGFNRTFFINAIMKKSSHAPSLTAAPAKDPYFISNSTTNATDEDPCYCHLWRKPKPVPKDGTILGIPSSYVTYYMRIICESLTFVFSLLYLIGAANEARFQGLQMFVQNLSTVPSRVLFLFACILVMLMGFLRATCQSEAEDNVAVLSMLCTGPYFLFFCRGFKTVGPFVTMIYTMLVGDLLRFVTIYSFFVMGFSQAYYVLFTSYHIKSSSSQCDINPLNTPVESVMKMFIMSLGNFGDTYLEMECTDHVITGKIMFMIFMAIVSILLINLLIAMMGNTYTIIAEMKNEWMRQWARIVLVVERGVSPEERLKQQMAYSQPMSDGRRALVLRLHQNDEEREEMKDIMDMKRVHKRYVERRKAKLNTLAAPFADPIRDVIQGPQGKP